MQVDPIKPALKGAGTKRLTLKYYKLLSKCPFKFNLRRHTEDVGVPNVTIAGFLEVGADGITGSGDVWSAGPYPRPLLTSS